MVFARYIRTLAVSFVFCYCIFFLLVFLQIGGKTESSRWISELYQVKTDTVAQMNTPKLVLVGASDVGFGISCEMLDAALNIPCVNGGTHGGLDTDYILYKAKTWIHPGDVVLLSLPYDLYSFDGRPRDTLIDYVLARDPNYLLSVNWLTQVRFLTGATLSRIVTGLSNKIMPPAPSAQGYSAETLNRYGDETVNWVQESGQHSPERLNRFEPQHAINGYISDSYGMDRIREFAAWCRSQESQLLVTYPNTVWFDIYDGKRQKAFFQSIQDFYETLDVPILGRHKDFMYDTSLMYDTVYHLNYAGVQRRTEAVIRLIRPFVSPIQRASDAHTIAAHIAHIL